MFSMLTVTNFMSFLLMTSSVRLDFLSIWYFFLMLLLSRAELRLTEPLFT